MEQLDLAIRTLFSEFQEIVFSRQRIEEDLNRQSIYVKKTVKQKRYWYLQQYINGHAHQKYFGPSNSKNDETVQQKREEQKQQRRLLQKLSSSESKLASMLRRAGIPCLDAATANTIGGLSEILSAKGSILVGSHAFSTYCGMLGVLFDHHLLKTMDIDIAFDNIVALVGPSLNIGEILKKVDPGFREVPGLSHKYPPNSFISPSGIRVDILAPLVGKSRSSINVKGIIGAAAEPLRYLDFLIKDPARTVLIGPKGGISVFVPDPVRFALHKLIVSSCRSAVETTKRVKDLSQATQLLEVCIKERESDLVLVYKEAIKKGPKWKKAIQKNMPSHIASVLK